MDSTVYSAAHRFMVLTYDPETDTFTCPNGKKLVHTYDSHRKSDNRFLTRGKRKTETQFFLLAFAYNIRKLCNRLETGRFGVALFDVDVA